MCIRDRLRVAIQVTEMYLWMCHHERCCLNSSVGATTMRCGNQYRLCWNLIKLSKTIHHLAFELHIAPLASRSAVRVAIESEREEFARELTSTALELIRALDK